MRQVGAGPGRSPASWRAARRATSAWTTAPSAALSATVACASGTRTSSVACTGCRRSSHHHCAGAGHDAGAQRPAVGARPAPRGRCSGGGTPWRGSSSRELRAHGVQAAVVPVVEGRVGAQRGELGEVRAHRVVDGQRPVGAAHGDVDVQAEDELAPRHGPELGAGEGVALVLAEHARPARRRDARPRRRSGPGRRRRATSAARPSRQRGGGGADRRRRRREDLDLRGGQLALEARVAAGGREDPLGHRREVERLRVEDQDLLLEPDRQARTARRRPRAGRPPSAAREGRRTGSSVCARAPQDSRGPVRLLTAPGVHRPDQRHLDAGRGAARAGPAAGRRAAGPLHGHAGRWRCGRRCACAPRPPPSTCPAAPCCSPASTRASTACASARVRGDLLAAVDGERFDAIVANPPYVPSAAGHRRAAHPRPAPRLGRRPRRARRPGPHLREAPDAPAARRRGPARPLLGQRRRRRPSTAWRPAAWRPASPRATPARSGPLMRSRAAALEARGLLRPGQRDEEVVVVRGRRPAS